MKDLVTPVIGAGGFFAALTLGEINQWLEFVVAVLTIAHLVYKFRKKPKTP